MIKLIGFEETYSIRHQVMWPNESVDFIKVEGDQEADHYGYFLDHQLIAVISVFTGINGFQIRKFACLEVYQGKGYGSALLRSVINKYEGHIYLNARIEKVDFYKKFGFKTTDQTFYKKDQHYVIMDMDQ